ncbi:hypothetical protein AGMMS50284_5020 [Clostridia bacterium]|nr:hypothetical protein AGMMS50284_5020 [Clostridia bacterium]
MRGYISYFAYDDAGKLALFKEEDKEIWKINRKDSPFFKLIDYTRRMPKAAHRLWQCVGGALKQLYSE